MQHAREEIDRLNIEICRVVTYIADETIFLWTKESSLAQTNPLLAHQIAVYRLERGRANATHSARFAKLAKNSKFTGQVTKGRSIHLPTISVESCDETSSDIHINDDEEDNAEDEADEGEDEEDDEDDEEEQEEEAFDIAYEVIKVTSDDHFLRQEDDHDW